MGHNDYTIRKFGRWTSDTWQMYIHGQIAKLSEGFAQNMSPPIAHQSIALIDPTQQ